MDSADEYRGYISEFFSIILVFVLMCLVYHLVSSCITIDTKLMQQEIDKVVYSPYYYFRPEPIERYTYISFLLIGPITVFASIVLLFNLMRRVGDKLVTAVYVVVSLLTVVMISYIIWEDMSVSPWFLNSLYLYALPGYFNPGWFTLVACAFIVFLLLYYYFRRFYPRKVREKLVYLLDLAAVSLACFVSLINFVDVSSVDFWGYTTSLDAYLHSVVVVYSGRPLLTSFPNQYGLYAHILEPVFRIIGLNVLKFTSVMAMLLAVSLLSWYFLLRGVVRNRFIAFSGFITTLYFSFLYLKATAIDLYYQFFPHRMLFPGLFLLLSCYYFMTRKKSVYYASFIICSIGVLWNLETGASVFLAWTAGLVYQEFLGEGGVSRNEGIKRSLRHAITGFIVMISVLLFYVIYIFLRYGVYPDINYFFVFHRVFYFSGFYMLPMAAIHPWNILILIYLIGLAHSAKYLVFRDNTTRAKVTFILSVLGLLVFSYYQGRSHDYVLTTISYPAFLLMAIFADSLYYQTKKDFAVRRVDVMRLSMLFGIMVVMLSAILSTCAQLPPIRYVIEDHFNRMLAGVETPVTNGVEFIKKHTKPGQEVFVVSYFNSGVYNIESGTRSSDVQSASEIVLKEDVRRIVNFLRSDDRGSNVVFFDKALLTDPITWEVRNELYINYIQLNGTEDTPLIYYLKLPSPCNRTAYLFEKDSNSLFHAVQNDFHLYCDLVTGRFAARSDGKTSQSIRLENNFSIEVLVIPTENDTPYATIISNHPGWESHQGFVLHRVPGKENRYFLGYGNGTAWLESATFDLYPAIRDYIAITTDGDFLKVYVNGVLADSSDYVYNIKNSDFPLYIGNWIEETRPFNGFISEVKISGAPLTADYIASKWYQIQNVSNNNIL